MSRSEIWTTDDIWKLTSGGEDIFKQELKDINYTKNVKSPFRTDDNPSFKLSRSNSNIVYGQDFGGNQFNGNALEFLMERYGLTFPQAIQKVVNEFYLKKEDIYQKKTFETKKVSKVHKSSLLIEFTDIPFTKKHKKYFDQYQLDEEFLRNHDVYAVGKLAFNKKVIPIPDYQYCFAYWAKDINKVKLLTLGEKVEKKWINTAPNSYLWFYNQIDKENCKQLWIVKSVKDLLVFKKHFGFQGVAVQNESAKIFMQSKNYEKLESITNDIVLALGTDPQGKEQSIIISKERNYKWFNIPNNLYNSYEMEDVSDYVANFSVKSLGNLLKVKNYL